MVLGNPVLPGPADHEPRSDLHCPKNRRAENLIKNRHSVLTVSYITHSQTTNTKNNPCHTSEKRSQCQRRGGEGIIGGH